MTTDAPEPSDRIIHHVIDPQPGEQAPGWYAPQVVEPHELEDLYGWRVRVGTEFETLARVWPTRAEWTRMRGDTAPDVPGHVRLYIAGTPDRPDVRCIGTAYEPVTVYPPADRAPVHVFVGDRAHWATVAGVAPAKLDQFVSALTVAALAEDPDGTGGDRMPRLVTLEDLRLDSDLALPMRYRADIAAAVSDGHRVYLVDPALNVNWMFTARDAGLPGIAADADGRLFMTRYVNPDRILAYMLRAGRVDDVDLARQLQLPQVPSVEEIGHQFPMMTWMVDEEDPSKLRSVTPMRHVLSVDPDAEVPAPDDDGLEESVLTAACFENLPDPAADGAFVLDGVDVSTVVVAAVMAGWITLDTRRLTAAGEARLAALWGPDRLPPGVGGYFDCGEHGVYDAHPGDLAGCPDCRREQGEEVPPSSDS